MTMKEFWNKSKKGYVIFCLVIYPIVLGFLLFMIWILSNACGAYPY